MYPADFKPVKKLKPPHPTHIHTKSVKSAITISSDEDTSPDEEFNGRSSVPNLLKKIKKTSPRTSTPTKSASETPKSPEVETATPVDQPKSPTVPEAPAQPSTQEQQESSATKETVPPAPKVPDNPEAGPVVSAAEGDQPKASDGVEDVTPVSTPTQDQLKPGPSSDSGIVL